MELSELQENDVEWTHGHMDPVARTFFYEGSYYKAVKPAAEPYLLSLFKTNLIDTLCQKNLIPATEFSNIKMQGFNIVLKQKTEFFYVNPTYFSPMLAKDAALMYLELCSALVENNLGLIDGHPFNIVIQDNSKPKWCDIGSIIKLRDANDLRGLDEFVRHFVYPLLCRNKAQAFDKIMRHFLTEGCSHEEAQLLLGSTIRLGGSRREVIDALKKFLEDLDFPWGKTLWSDYHKEYHGEKMRTSVLMDMNNTDFKAVHVRDAVLKRLFRTLKPQRVIDFGANAGVQSMLIAQTGAEVMAYELDEQAASMCHLNFAAFPKQLRMKVALAPFGKPTADKRPDLALALTHHLFFTHNYTFDIMAKILADCTTDILLTEFMPDGLGVGKPHIYPLPQNYTLEIFVRELAKYFQSIEVVDYAGFAHRKLIIARGRFASTAAA